MGGSSSEFKPDAYDLRSIILCLVKNELHPSLEEVHTYLPAYIPPGSPIPDLLEVRKTVVDLLIAGLLKPVGDVREDIFLPTYLDLTESGERELRRGHCYWDPTGILSDALMIEVDADPLATYPLFDDLPEEEIVSLSRVYVRWVFSEETNSYKFSWVDAAIKGFLRTGRKGELDRLFPRAVEVLSKDSLVELIVWINRLPDAVIDSLSDSSISFLCDTLMGMAQRLVIDCPSEVGEIEGCEDPRVLALRIFEFAEEISSHYRMKVDSSISHEFGNFLTFLWNRASSFLGKSILNSSKGIYLETVEMTSRMCSLVDDLIESDECVKRFDRERGVRARLGSLHWLLRIMEFMAVSTKIPVREIRKEYSRAIVEAFDRGLSVVLGPIISALHQGKISGVFVLDLIGEDRYGGMGENMESLREDLRRLVEGLSEIAEKTREGGVSEQERIEIMFKYIIDVLGEIRRSQVEWKEVLFEVQEILERIHSMVSQLRSSPRRDDLLKEIEGEVRHLREKLGRRANLSLSIGIPLLAAISFSLEVPIR